MGSPNQRVLLIVNPQRLHERRPWTLGGIIEMKKRRLIVLWCLSAAIPVIGLGFVLLGGYGECGPESNLATIGSWMCFLPMWIVLACPVVGSWIDTALNAAARQPQPLYMFTMSANYFFGFLTATAFWWIVLFIGLGTWSWIKRRRKISPNHTSEDIVAKRAESSR